MLSGLDGMLFVCPPEDRVFATELVPASLRASFERIAAERIGRS